MHPEDREKEIRLLQNRAEAVWKQVAPKTPSTPSSGSLDDAQPSYLRSAWVATCLFGRGRLLSLALCAQLG